ncbi:MAG: PAS domain-containing protein [Mycobacteriaceae bacterium]|nr:PAS domain-containing protein [Mycobacteriaceae bacterium]
MDASEATRTASRSTVTVDRHGIILQWGDAVTEIVGHSAAETIGRSLNVVIPPVFRPLHWWGFDRAMKQGRMSGETLKLPALCKDGRIVVTHARIELIPGKLAPTEGAVVTFVGVGPRWQARAWGAALGPIDFAQRIWRRTRSAR